MSERTQTDRRGTFWDWPVGLMVAAVVLFVVSAGRLLPLAGLVFFVALVIWLARRGTFASRR